VKDFEMRVLFISRGNKFGDPGVVAANQLESLRRYTELKIDYLPVMGKGITGYLKSVRVINKKIREYNYDVVHANYSFCGYIAALASSKPLVVSLMGSDTQHNGLFSAITRYFVRHKWKRTIVKSESMKIDLGISKNVEVIPNGVDVDKITAISFEEALEFSEFNKDLINIVFIGNPNRYSKNGALATAVVNEVKVPALKLHFIYDLPHRDSLKYIKSADVVLMTSRYEGSPNTIKEAMACNIPIVSTDVGDVRYLLAGLNGCYVCSHDKSDLSNQLLAAIDFARNHGQTKGLERIKSLGLDAASIARNIERLYKDIL
jgi:teichuronic acid biosynthesis glycosyltransferase TuaC